MTTKEQNLAQQLIDSNYEVMKSISNLKRFLNQKLRHLIFVTLLFQLALQAFVEIMRMRAGM